MKSKEPTFSSLLRGLIVPTILYFSVFALWAFNSPIGASPDEPRHIATAYGVTHGSIGSFDAEVPNWISDLGKGQDGSPCYAWNPNQGADCVEKSENSQDKSIVTSQFGSYFPAYYLLVGSSTLIATGDLALILMRLTSSLLCAIILGLSTWAIVGGVRDSTRKLAYIVPFTLLPMAVFLYGSVNSSGMEIASAVYFWCASLMLFSNKHEKNHKFVTTHFTCAALLLLSTRLLAPLWIIAILVLVGLFTNNFLQNVKQLLSTTFFRFALVVISAYTAIVIMWDILHPNYYLDPNQKPVDSFAEGVKEVSHFLLNSSLHTVFEFGIGQLGWGDTILPLALITTLLIWGSLIGALLVFSPETKSIFRLAILVASPIVASSIIAGIGWSGVGWQGRYSLPLLLGIPIVLVFLYSESSQKFVNQLPSQNTSRLLSVLLALTFIVLTYAFFMNYHRYSAGTDAFILSPNRSWAPEITFPVLFLAVIAAQYLIYRMTVQFQSEKH